MKRILILVAGSLFLNVISSSQNSIILQPGSEDQRDDCITATLQPHESGKDCEIFSLLPDKNYVSDLLRGNAWTWSGTHGVERGLFQFDLSFIPEGYAIESAYLDLYSPNPPSTEFHSGKNATFLKRITSDWKETSVTWNSQPATTDINQISLPTSVSPYQDYLHIDVKKLVIDMVENPDNSFGFMIMQQDEHIYHRMTFCSSDYPDQSKHPRLVICYAPKDCTTLVLQPGPSGKDCEVFSLQPNLNYVSNLLRGNCWTFSGKPGVQRGLIEFDLSSIPPESTINWARISLYAPRAPSSQFHYGINQSIIQRIVSPWSESTVTWKTQPFTTTVHEAFLQTSTSPYQDYTDIDVTEMVQDMTDNPSLSHGFMIKLQQEKLYRRLSFCSGDYPDPTRHPKLEICYTFHPRSKSMTRNSTEEFSIYPNPVSDWVRVDISSNQKIYKLQIMDLLQRIVYNSVISDHDQIEMSDLPPSIYIFCIRNEYDEILYTTKIIKR